MHNTNYVPGDLVDVRSSVVAWYPGVVSLVDATKIVVALDAPLPTGDEWSGVTMRYGGSAPVDAVTVWKASEAVATHPDSACSHIRMRSAG